MLNTGRHRSLRCLLTQRFYDHWLKNAAVCTQATYMSPSIFSDVKCVVEKVLTSYHQLDFRLL